MSASPIRCLLRVYMMHLLLDMHLWHRSRGDFHVFRSPSEILPRSFRRLGDITHEAGRDTFCPLVLLVLQDEVKTSCVDFCESSYSHPRSSLHLNVPRPCCCASE